MKNLKFIFAIFLVAIFCCFISCTNFENNSGNIGGAETPSKHEHTFSDEWKSDAEKHWHAATCEHKSLKKDETPHDWKVTTEEPTCTKVGKRTSICKVCEFIKTEELPMIDHSWDEGIVKRKPTETEDGVEMYTCKVCGEKKTELIPTIEHCHTFETEWTADDTHHWHAAACSHKALVSDKEEHTLIEDSLTGNITCSICGIVLDGGKKYATASDVVDTIRNLDSNCTVVVKGVIDSDIIFDICDALKDTTANIVLDLSKTTGLTEIPKNAFYYGSYKGAENLISIIIPNGVSSIGDYAFYECRGLESVTIPASVVSIGKTAFEATPKLSNVYAESLEKWCEITFENIHSNPLAYSKARLYIDGEELTDLVIPSNITEIKDYAFLYCKSLVNVTIPDTVTTIGKWIFAGCDNLESVSIGKNADCIGDSMFDLCRKLSSVTISYGVTSIGERAFCLCDSLTSIELPNSIVTIGSSAFDGAGLTSVVIPDSVTSIGFEAFYDCEWLENVTFGKNVAVIGYNSFRECRLLTSVIIPASVTTIAPYAFMSTNVIDGMKITSITFEYTTGWYYADSSKATSGTSIDVSDPAINAERLIKGSSDSSAWSKYYLKRN